MGDITVFPGMVPRNHIDFSARMGDAMTWFEGAPAEFNGLRAELLASTADVSAAVGNALDYKNAALEARDDALQAKDDAVAAKDDAEAAAAAAAGSASTAAGFTATSVSSLAIGTGTKVFAVGAGKSFQAGEYILAADQGDPANYMHGLATGYTGGNLTVDITSVGGSGTKAAWNVSLSGPAGPQGVGGSATQLRVAKTSNTKLVAADSGKLIDITSGTFTQTFDPASALGAGWTARIKNSGTGVITLDADATETFGAPNAATTAVLGPGQSALVVSDGANLYFADAPTTFRNMEVFTSSGTFTPKPGVTRYFIRAKGAGGGGSGNPTMGHQTGGGEGGEVSGFVVVTSAQTVTIGAGGPGGSSASGSSGGNTTFGALATANGGDGGVSNGPGIGGSGTMTGGVVERGSPGNFGYINTNGGSGGGRGGGVQASPDGTNGGGGAGKIGGTGGTGGNGFCIVMW